MAQNIGQVFETQWKASTPDYALLYRLPNPAQSFGGSNNLRFSAKPPFDFLMWDSIKHRLYALEMKSVGGKSISFERDKEDNGDIHYHQIKGLNKWNKFDGITCGFVIEFRKIEKTVFIDIEQMNRIIKLIPKKSFNFDDFYEYNIQYILIGQTKARTRYKYDVDKFLHDVR